MATNHRTARGVPVDMDRLRLQNETAIAVGNMKVNARGDQLGPGGKIVKTRAQVLSEKNKLHGAIADDFEVFDSLHSAGQAQPDLVQVVTNAVQPTAVDTPVVESSNPTEYVKPRGSFAEAVAEQKEVTQELLDPAEVLQISPSQPGIKRI